MRGAEDGDRDLIGLEVAAGEAVLLGARQWLAKQSVPATGTQRTAR